MGVSQSKAIDTMGSLLSEATTFDETKARKVLESPCVRKLTTGPCGSEFSEAFLCFLKSTAEEKGSDCVHAFVGLQNCILSNRDAFKRDVVVLPERIENKMMREDQKSSQGYRFHAQYMVSDNTSLKRKREHGHLLTK